MQAAPKRMRWHRGLVPDVQCSPPRLALLGLSAVLFVALISAAMSGAVDIPWNSVRELLSGSHEPGRGILRQVLLEIRGSRVLFIALVVGATGVTCVVFMAL